MPPLELKERFALEAVTGWLMLGNPVEAAREFEQIPSAARESPDGLKVLWDVHAHSRNWEAAIEAADRLIAAINDQPDGYIKRAYALHELKRTQEAWDTLQPVSELFKTNWLIPYNLSCYAAQLGRPDESLQWFRRTLRHADPGELRTMALNDPDLQPIRGKIEKLTSA